MFRPRPIHTGKETIKISLDSPMAENTHMQDCLH